jgi:hypothetical protein
MNDLVQLERLVADVAAEAAGPSRPVDVAAITGSATSQSPQWRVQPMFSATKYVAAGAIVALFGGFLLMAAPGDQRTAGVPAAPSGQAGAAAVSASPTPSALTVGGVPVSFVLPREAPGGVGWMTSGPRVQGLTEGLYVSADTYGSEAAEAMILWTSFPDSLPAYPCLLAPSAGASAADLADAVATAPGTKLVSGPADVTVGGQAAKHVVVMVAPDAFLEGVSGGTRMRTVGCDPGYFFGWESHAQGAFWQETVPGDTIGVWIVEVDGTLLFIEAETHTEAGPAVAQEIDDIIDSVRFE